MLLQIQAKALESLLKTIMLEIMKLEKVLDGNQNDIKLKVKYLIYYTDPVILLEIYSDGEHTDFFNWKKVRHSKVIYKLMVW